jgi:predicted metal-dependent phosphoesterase TrpH
MKMKRITIMLMASWLIFQAGAQPVRNELLVPDIDGYHTLKCDFHMHTVFSDGDVWPLTRVSEAWREGLDAIAITDHLEYTPHKEFVPVSHEAPYEIAKGPAEQAGLILIKGTEITKSMPPGHFNALFIDQATPIHNDDYKQALREAKQQGAFIIWNHPGWKAQAPDGPKWMDEHQELYEEKLFNGIEVVNYNEWYPEVLDWAADKNLTIFSNSDIHEPMSDYLLQNNADRRPITLVFAKERTPESIHEALLAGRTAGWFREYLFANEEILKQLLEQSIDVSITGKNEKNITYKIRNHTDLVFNLHFPVAGSDKLLPGRSAILITLPAKENHDQVTLKNLLSRSEKPLTAQLSSLMKK